MSEKLRVIVVDDEAPARDLLCEMLGDAGHVEVIARCANGFEAVKAVTEMAPDVLFLDVHMPKLDGFEVLELLGTEAPPVVFTTAYDHYAIKAFEIHAVDYLLKPFTEERLAEALSRLRRPVQVGGVGARPLVDSVRAEAAEAGAPTESFLDRILVRDGAQIHVISTDRLDYVEAQDDAVLLVAGAEKHRKSDRMARLEAGLDPRQFVRIHRSYLLNVERLSKLELYAKDSRLAILRDGTRLPVSRAGYARLRELL
ncbi:MAG: response regulator [Acidobacteriota bacterium]